MKLHTFSDSINNTTPTTMLHPQLLNELSSLSSVSIHTGSQNMARENASSSKREKVF